jgi:hypothetical protein
VHAHQWGCIAILLEILFDFWQLGVVKVDMLKFGGCHFGPQICKPRRYAGRIRAHGYLEGCQVAGQIDKDKEVLRISVDARGIVGASITVVVSRLYY